MLSAPHARSHESLKCSSAVGLPSLHFIRDVIRVLTDQEKWRDNLDN